jgi:hypothetical protein
MTDEPLEVLVIRKMPDGTFVAADTLQKLRIVQDGFATAPEAEKFIEDFYLARGVIRPRTPSTDRQYRMTRLASPQN